MTITDDKDYILENLVEYINGTDRELSITILIEGILITGRLVSGHRFIDQVRERVILEQTFNSEIKDLQNMHLGIMFEAISKAYVKQKDVLGSVSSLHLFDAKFHNGSGKGLNRQKGIPWRGRLDKVSGFYLND